MWPVADSARVFLGAIVKYLTQRKEDMGSAVFDKVCVQRGGGGSCFGVCFGRVRLQFPPASPQLLMLLLLKLLPLLLLSPCCCRCCCCCAAAAAAATAAAAAAARMMIWQLSL